MSSSAGAVAELLGQHDLADELFAEGVEVARSLRAPYHLAVAGLEWGRALRVRDGSDPDLAVELLTGALESARARGFGAVQREADLFLAAPR